MDGISFSRLGTKYGISKSKAWRLCQNELKKLPNNNQFSKKYCNRYSSTLMPDAKYISVKGYDRKIAFLWGVDYFKHDFPVCILGPSENYETWGKYFFTFRLLNHHYEVVVCDENIPLRDAAKRHFNDVRIQLCYNHIKEGYRRKLKVRSEETYRDFMKYLERALDTSERLPPHVRRERLQHMFEYALKNKLSMELTILKELDMKEINLFNYTRVKNIPCTTNLIECFNSHLEARLKSLRGFNSFEHANLWLNGYVLKRRFTPYTGCTGKFRKYNGKRPIDITKKKDIDIPEPF